MSRHYLAAPLLLLLSVFSCSSPPSGQPGIVLIILDTARLDRFGCYGSETVRTPHIDNLASRGILFENAFSQASYTLPSICTMITSLYPYRHQVRANDTNLNDQFKTMAEIFREEGYRTGAVVGSAVLDKGRKVSQGFDHYDDSFPEKMEVYDAALRRADVGIGDRLQRRAGDVTDRALSWLRDNRNSPFFLMAHYFDPHSLYDPPPPFNTEYSGRPYDGEIAYTDLQVGRLLDGLRDLDLHENTLVVLVGDHGESLGDHGEPEHGFFVYDETIHVPMILAFPGVIPEGKRVGSMVRSVDLLPTILGLMSMEPLRGIDGRDVTSAFESDGQYHSVPVYSEAFLGYSAYGWSPTKSIRTAKWKYVEAPQKELYFLPDDPNELNNLYDEEPGEARRLEKEMARHLQNESLVEKIDLKTEGISAEQRSRLEALGYLSGGNRERDLSFEKLIDPKVGVVQFRKRQEAKYLTFQGESFLREQNVKMAAERFQRALDLYSDLWSAWKGLAAVHLSQGGFLEAEKIYRRLIGEEPSDAELRVDLAIAITNQGKFAEAIDFLANQPDSLPKSQRYAQVLNALMAARAQGRPLTIR